MFSKAIIAAVAAASAVQAGHPTRTHGVGMFWQQPLVQGRIDPIVSAGKISQHVHYVVGGDGFSESMGDMDALNSKCTGSLVQADKSNYWFPQLYFQDPKTKQFESVNLNSLRAYYFFEGTDDDIKPFPPGFRMLSGSAFARSNYYKTPFDDHTAYDRGVEIQPVSWSCGRTDGKLAYPQGAVARAGGSTQGPGFPNIKCDQVGAPLASYIHFPSCADLTQPYANYANNTAWPTIHYGSDGSQKQNCPAGYTHLPHLFLEIKWSTPDFANRWTEGVDAQPFVLAQGDKTGFGAHADFISGWDENVLQHLIDTCDSGAHGDGLDSCPGIANFNAAGSHPSSCTVKSPIAETVTGTMSQLPGCNPIQAGPQNAMMCDCSGSTPVCNIPVGSGGPTSGSGSGAGSGAGSGSGSGSSSVAASSSKAPTSTASVTHTTGTASVVQPTGTATSSAAEPTSTDSEGDYGDGGDDGDEGCDAPDPEPSSTLVKKPIATPYPLHARTLGRPLSHMHMHMHQERHS